MGTQTEVVIENIPPSMTDNAIKAAVAKTFKGVEIISLVRNGPYANIVFGVSIARGPEGRMKWTDFSG
ncbi:hypothetical protein I5P86_06090 [Pseudomonas glycinae]|uniref:hypothetical protein n=1 Tax=Pseudomonas TaxID=286 RepID=UPI0018D82662|nr:MULTISPECIES: hypothetical protein [Pseudomonas]MBH3404617.1 hypothetical protein [Pseudomonas glycinae]MDI3398689.1 hypothetical protein [Pseudomonas sp. V88_4]